MIVKMGAYYDGESWCARGLTEGIFTQGATMDELLANVKEAVALHYEGTDQRPEVLLLAEVMPDYAEAAAG